MAQRMNFLVSHCRNRGERHVKGIEVRIPVYDVESKRAHAERQQEQSGDQDNAPEQSGIHGTNSINGFLL